MTIPGSSLLLQSGLPGIRLVAVRLRSVQTIVWLTTGPTLSSSRRLSSRVLPDLTRAVTNNTFGQNGGLLRTGVPVLNSNDVTPLQFRQPPSFSTNSLNVVDPDLASPRTHQYSVSFQREIGGKNVLEINYIGRQGRGLYRWL